MFYFTCNHGLSGMKNKPHHKFQNDHGIIILHHLHSGSNGHMTIAGYLPKNRRTINEQCIQQKISPNLELRISYASGLSSWMKVPCRFVRLCALSFSDDNSSLEVSADVDLTFRNKSPNVAEMSSNLGGAKELQWRTTQNAQQMRSSLENCITQLIPVSVLCFP